MYHITSLHTNHCHIYRNVCFQCLPNRSTVDSIVCGIDRKGGVFRMLHPNKCFHSIPNEFNFWDVRFLSMLKINLPKYGPSIQYRANGFSTMSSNRLPTHIISNNFYNEARRSKRSSFIIHSYKYSRAYLSF